MAEIPDVRVGQVWADNDKRSAGRHLKVVDLIPADPGGPHRFPKPAKAEVALCTADGRVIRDHRGRDKRTQIAITRFRPTSTGYRLVQDVTASETNPSGGAS